MVSKLRISDLHHARLGNDGYRWHHFGEGKINKTVREVSEVVHGTHGVWTQDAGAALAGDPDDLGLSCLAVLVGIGESLADDDDRLDSNLDALLDGRDDMVSSYEDDGEVHHLRHVCYRRIGLEAANLVGLRVDGIDAAFKPIAEHHLDAVVRPWPRLSGSTDHDHGFRLKKITHVNEPPEFS